MSRVNDSPVPFAASGTACSRVRYRFPSDVNSFETAPGRNVSTHKNASALCRA